MKNLSSILHQDKVAKRTRGKAHTLNRNTNESFRRPARSMKKEAIA
jgi:hypothetical protein